MSKVNYCLNGNPVIDQVEKYRINKTSEDFLPILFYYENYKEVWYAQLSDYMDRTTFDSEFEFKLIHAINSFNPEHANEFAASKKLSRLGNFNRWFYKILTNWKSNIKTSAFRLKKRPSIMCPVCGRKVGRIDEAHLLHQKTKSDLPHYMVWEGMIYEVANKPGIYAITWGVHTSDKWNDLNDGKSKEYADEKRRIRWPWRLPDGSRGVLCPFTQKTIAALDEEYLQSLPNQYGKYAECITWDEFNSRYPHALIQSETFSLDYNPNSDSSFLNEIVAGQVCEEEMSYDEIKNGDVSTRYEYTFRTIEQCVHDETDRMILKLVASGYETDDIAESLELDKKDIKKRLRAIRDCAELETLLRN
jgi:hypothetical protein